MSDNIKIPLSAADDVPENKDEYIPASTEAYIPNLCKGKEYLTVIEALDQISKLSGFIMADQYRRSDESRKRIG